MNKSIFRTLINLLMFNLSTWVMPKEIREEIFEDIPNLKEIIFKFLAELKAILYISLPYIRAFRLIKK